MSEVLAKALNERTLRVRINRVITASLLERRPFIPANAVRHLSSWLLSLKMQKDERRIIAGLTKQILIEYERRLRWMGQQLEQDVFKRFGD